MRTVSHREMRNESGAILRAVAAGETVQVTNAGRIAAVISPPSSSALDELEARGALRPARRPTSDLAQVQRRPASRGSAELLADSRGRW